MNTKTITVLAAACLATASAHALEPLRPYDNFAAAPLDLSRWLETERVRVIRGGALNLAQRTPVTTAADSGLSFSSWNENLANPAAVTALRAKVTVNAADPAACAANPAAGQARARIIGSFFNVGTPVPGSQLGDVLAQVRLTRFSNSTDAPGVLRVQGIVSQCTSADCAATTTIGSLVDLGTVNVGTATTVQLQWDAPAKTFLFARDGGAQSGSVVYAISDTTPPSVPFKQLSTRLDLPACASTPALQGWVDASFDNVSVNRSAAP